MRSESSSTASRLLARSLVGVVATLAVACVDPALAPDRAPVVASADRVELGTCGKLAAPEGSTLVLKAFGVGFQIYHWNGTSWGPATPDATLYADATLNGVLASHFAGPTWKSNSGGSVVGTVASSLPPLVALVAAAA